MPKMTQLPVWYKRYLMYKNRFFMESSTPFRYASSYDKEVVSKILRENGVDEIRCLSCGARLSLADLMYYNDHPAGINGGKWYFFRCPMCGYDTSLEKILIKARMGRLQH